MENRDLAKEHVSMNSSIDFICNAGAFFHENATFANYDYRGILADVDTDDPIKNLWIFHHNDLDGYASAAVILNFYEKYYLPNAINKERLHIHTYSIDYMRSFSEDSKRINPVNSEVWFVDYSFSNKENYDEFRRLMNILPKGRLVWIDHHLSSSIIVSKDKYELKNVTGLIDDKSFLSGAMLTWLYCYSVAKYQQHKIPRFISMVSDWDTFTKAYPNIIEFKAGTDLAFDPNHEKFNMRSLLDIDGRFETLNPVWKDLVNDNRELLSAIIKEGKNAVKVRASDDRKKRGLMGNSLDMTIGANTYSVYVLNSFGNSLTFGREYYKHDFVILFFYIAKTRNYSYSLYSDKNFVNCAEIAALFGGGGHKGAAGFSLGYNIFERGEYSSTGTAININRLIIKGVDDM